MQQEQKKLLDEAIREIEVSGAKQREALKIDILSVLSTSNDFSYEECAEEKEASLEFDRALDSKVEDFETNKELSNLACDWYAAGRNAGFKAGFRLATKLLVAGMS